MQSKINEYFNKLCKDKFLKNDDEEIIGKAKDVIENLKEQLNFEKNSEENIDNETREFVEKSASELIKEIKNNYKNEMDVIYIAVHPMSGFYELQERQYLMEELEDYYYEMEDNKNGN